MSSPECDWGCRDPIPVRDMPKLEQNIDSSGQYSPMSLFLVVELSLDKISR